MRAVESEAEFLQPFQGGCASLKEGSAKFVMVLCFDPCRSEAPRVFCMVLPAIFDSGTGLVSRSIARKRADGNAGGTAGFWALFQQEHSNPELGSTDGRGEAAAACPDDDHVKGLREARHGVKGEAPLDFPTEGVSI
tara:strand:- start:814 stop:1224 length:411 start_codon:yes stop_codon:yes gene_type:complete